jgi:hypothetical protein
MSFYRTTLHGQSCDVCPSYFLIGLHVHACPVVQWCRCLTLFVLRIFLFYAASANLPKHLRLQLKLWLLLLRLWLKMRMLSELLPLCPLMLYEKLVACTSPWVDVRTEKCFLQTLRAEAEHFAKVNPPKTMSSMLPGFFAGMVSVLIPASPPRYSVMVSYADTLLGYRAMFDQLVSIASFPSHGGPVLVPSSCTGGDVFKFPRTADTATFPDGRPAPDVDLSRIISFQMSLSRHNPTIIVRSRLWVWFQFLIHVVLKSLQSALLVAIAASDWQHWSLVRSARIANCCSRFPC